MSSIRSPHHPFPVAVIDIGSNSGRVVVLERDRAGHLRLLTGSRAPLRLVHDVDEQQSLSEESMARTMEAIRDFHAIAAGVGAKRIVAVATAAMRDARNGGLFMDRIRRELRVRVEIIDGQEEARYGFAGAVGAFPCRAASCSTSVAAACRCRTSSCGGWLVPPACLWARSA